MRRHNHSGGSGPLAAHRSGQSGARSPRDAALAVIRMFESEINPTRPARPSPLAASTFRGMPLDLVEKIRSFPLFASAPDSFLAAIGSTLRPQLFAPQETILSEGDDAKAMYWLVRGAVMVSSRDRESVYAELKPGAFFGEIGILMGMPRTASVVARQRSLVLRLNKDDLQNELPNYPEVERAIREEAAERLAILNRKKREEGLGLSGTPQRPGEPSRKRSRDHNADFDIREVDSMEDLEIQTMKKRKSPSPGLVEAAASSALNNGLLHVRQLLKELPLFSTLPDEILHFLGLNAQPRTCPPFTDIIKQGSQGREVYFIVDGEVEVFTDYQTTADRRPSFESRHHVKARLRAGQYFGEVTSLSLAPRRTANVRTVTKTECIMISGEVLDELWRRCSPDLRRQMEQTAKARLLAKEDEDVLMEDVENTMAVKHLAVLSDAAAKGKRRDHKPPPIITNTPAAIPLSSPTLEPFDPDPFFAEVPMPRRPRSRRASLASIPTDGSPLAEGESRRVPRPPSPFSAMSPSTSRPSTPIALRPRFWRQPSRYGKGVFPDRVLELIFQHLDIRHLLRLRQVSPHWRDLLSKSHNILQELDLSLYNRRVTDQALVQVICPFVQTRPLMINMSNCFHITDEGFNALATQCGANVKTWKMKSVWEIGPQAVLEMASKVPCLEEIDFSNCRKVSDSLLTRVIGHIVQEGHHKTSRHTPIRTHNNVSMFGCPSLSRLTLSYCKHISDRSMAYLAQHAADRLEEINLTRCTTITDLGFQHWSIYTFPRLRKLVLADCTYLSDNAIVYLTHATKALRELDLSFCCALSDTATEVLSLGCPTLTHLNLAFCGSAVSDTSMRSLGLHLPELRFLSVRGCVRVTGAGVEAVVGGCAKLRLFDVSQCKNLRPWLEAGGVSRWGVYAKDDGDAALWNGERSYGDAAWPAGGRGVVFRTVADGRWRVSL